MKTNGRNIRTYQGGELIALEVECSYSESLEFVAVRVNKDMDIVRSDSTQIEIKYEDKTLLAREFSFMDVITDADDQCLSQDLIIFHNGNINIVLDYLNIDALDNLNSRFNNLERLLQSEMKTTKEAFDNLDRAIDDFKNVMGSYFIPILRKLNAKLLKIELWIRRIFKAV